MFGALLQVGEPVGDWESGEANLPFPVSASVAKLLDEQILSCKNLSQRCLSRKATHEVMNVSSV